MLEYRLLHQPTEHDLNELAAQGFRVTHLAMAQAPHYVAFIVIAERDVPSEQGQVQAQAERRAAMTGFGSTREGDSGQGS